MSARILAVLVFFVPLLPPMGTSDFDVPKWTLIVLGGAICLALGRRDCFRHSTAGWTAVFLGLVVFSILSAVVCWYQDVHLHDIGRGLIRLHGMIMLAWLVNAVFLDEGGRRGIVLAGAFAPVAVWCVQLLLQSGVKVAGVPFDPGGWTSTMGNSGLVGSFAAVSLGFVALLPTATRTRFGALALTLVTLIPTLCLVLKSDARAAWLGAAAFLLVKLVLVGRSQGRIGRRLAVLILVCAPLLGIGTIVGVRSTGPTEGFLARAASIVDPDHSTNRVRLGLWKGSLGMLADSPWIGVGAGRFQDEFPGHRQPEEWAISGFRSVVAHPHNELIRWTTEHGILGGIAALVLLTLLTRALVLHFADPESALSGSQASSALATLAAAVVVSLFWDAFRQPTVVLPLGMMVGMGLRRPSPAETPSSQLVPTIATMTTICSIAIALMWIRYDTNGISLRDECEDTKSLLLQNVKAGEFNEVLLVTLGNISKNMINHVRAEPTDSGVRFRLLQSLLGLHQSRRELQVIAEVLEMEDDRRKILVDSFAHLPGAASMREILEYSHRRSPKHIGTLLMLSGFEQQAGRISEAVGWLEKVRETNDKAPLARRFQAEIRLDRAREYSDNSLYADAISSLREELSIYPSARESDPTWEILARTVGSTRDIPGGLSVVAQWVDAMGNEDHRLAVAGEMTLHYGETATTTGLFLEPSEDTSLRMQRGTLLVASLSGSDPRERMQSTLAHIGRHPNDVAAFDGLSVAIGEILEHARDDNAQRLRQMRSRAIARSRVQWIWQHMESGNVELADRLIRVALKHYEEQGDLRLLQILRHLENGKNDAALQALTSWKGRGMNPSNLKGLHPALDEFMKRPTVRKIMLKR